MTPMRVMPALYIRSIAPIQSLRSGLIGFLINTGMSTPSSASATSCTENGLTVVRAPIQSTSMPYFSASKTCWVFATSVVTFNPVSSFTRRSQPKPVVPMPSNSPGRVRGFQIPALYRSMFCAANSWAACNTCSSVSALQGPAMIIGRFSALPKMGLKVIVVIVMFFIQQFEI